MLRSILFISLQTPRSKLLQLIPLITSAIMRRRDSSIIVLLTSNSFLVVNPVPVTTVLDLVEGSSNSVKNTK